MPKYFYDCPSCKKSIRVDGRTWDAAEWLVNKYMAEGRVCKDCYGQQLKQARRDEYLTACQFRDALGLPALQGSKAQTDYAEKVRMQLISQIMLIEHIHSAHGDWIGFDKLQTNDKQAFIDNYAAEFEAKYGDSDKTNWNSYRWHSGELAKLISPERLAVLKYLALQVPSAGWWLDNSTMPCMAKHMQGAIDLYFASQKSLPETMPEAAEVLGEALLKPEGEPISPCIAELGLRGLTMIGIRFEERAESFRRVMSDLRFGFEDGLWCKTLRRPTKYKTWREFRDFLLETYQGDCKQVFVDRFAKQGDSESTCQQQCRQILLNDIENNVPVVKRDDKPSAMDKWKELL